MPWGFVCGFPTARGDLYGGAHYMQSAGNTTLQGQAIESAGKRFVCSKGEMTLPFTPCKKGFLPYCSSTGQRMYACPLRNEARKQRFESENWNFRVGEVNLNLLWHENKQKSDDAEAVKDTFGTGKPAMCLPMNRKRKANEL